MVSIWLSVQAGTYWCHNFDKWRSQIGCQLPSWIPASDCRACSQWPGFVTFRNCASTETAVPGRRRSACFWEIVRWQSGNEVRPRLQALHQYVTIWLLHMFGHVVFGYLMVFVCTQSTMVNLLRSHYVKLWKTAFTSNRRNKTSSTEWWKTSQPPDDQTYLPRPAIQKIMKTYENGSETQNTEGKCQTWSKLIWSQRHLLVVYFVIPTCHNWCYTHDVRQHLLHIAQWHITWNRDKNRLMGAEFPVNSLLVWWPLLQCHQGWEQKPSPFGSWVRPVAMAHLGEFMELIQDCRRCRLKCVPNRQSWWKWTTLVDHCRLAKEKRFHKGGKVAFVVPETFMLPHCWHQPPSWVVKNDRFDTNLRNPNLWLVPTHHRHIATMKESIMLSTCGGAFPNGVPHWLMTKQ